MTLIFRWGGKCRDNPSNHDLFPSKIPQAPVGSDNDRPPGRVESPRSAIFAHLEEPRPSPLPPTGHRPARSGLSKGQFLPPRKIAEGLALSYFNGAKAKKFRDWRRLENEQIRLSVALTGIKMTVWFPGTLGGLRLGRRVQFAALQSRVKEKRRVAPPAPDSLTLQLCDICGRFVPSASLACAAP